MTQYEQTAGGNSMNQLPTQPPAVLPPAIPICDVSRDGSDATGTGSRMCLFCGTPITSNPRARYCSRAHKMKAHRLRHQPAASALLIQLTSELRERQALVGQTYMNVRAATSDFSVTTAATNATSCPESSGSVVTAQTVTRSSSSPSCSVSRDGPDFGARQPFQLRTYVPY